MGWRWVLAEPLSAAQLKRLEQHRYSATGRSLLEPPLQLYWAWLVERAPAWLAPNAITLAGFVVNLLPALLLFAYCPTATEEVAAAPGGRGGSVGRGRERVRPCKRRGHWRGGGRGSAGQSSGRRPLPEGGARLGARAANLEETLAREKKPL